jgi:hypothetical protein
MLNLRTIGLSLALVAAAMLAIGLTTGQSQANKNSAGSEMIAPAWTAGDWARLYRASLGDCFDVPVSEQANCQKASQPSWSTYRDRGDECFDVPIAEVRDCREAGEAVTP